MVKTVMIRSRNTWDLNSRKNTTLRCSRNAPSMRQSRAVVGLHCIDTLLHEPDLAIRHLSNHGL